MEHLFQLPNGNSTTLTNEQALDLLNRFRQVFGWEGTEFQRVDVEDSLGRALTENEWNEVQDNYFWRKGVTEQACQGGWDAISELINDMNLEV